MPAAFLPSPARGVWSLGPVPVRGYALCLVLGVVLALWITDLRYRGIGGRPGLILDLATVAVPAGLIGARLYSVIVNYSRYFGHGQDWLNVLRIWDGGLGWPGAIVAGALGAWVICRRTGKGLRPVVAAAAPALAFGQAVGVWGNWFTQSLYGPPSMLPWAVQIAPEYRANGYESAATFQPMFLYQSLWDILAGLLVIYAIRLLLLTGDRAFALYAGLYAAGRFAVVGLSLGSSPRLLGLRADQVLMLAVCAAAAGYLYLTRARRGPDVLVPVSGRGRDGAGGTGAMRAGLQGAGSAAAGAGAADSQAADGAAADDAALGGRAAVGVTQPHRDAAPAGTAAEVAPR